MAALLRGKTAEEAVELMPRLFNLCRAAQETGVRTALGLDVSPTLMAEARAEMVRDHVLKLCITVPQKLGFSPVALPAGWQKDEALARRAIFGDDGWPKDFNAFLRSGLGVAPVLTAVREAFGTWADTGPLPTPTPDNMFKRKPVENSPAGRNASRKLMHEIAASDGHGPLWRLVGRLFDLTLPMTPPRLTAHGAIACAPRGAYALRVTTVGDRVADVVRITPTDHLLAQGGALERSLDNLPDAGLVPLLLDILDPCSPVTVKEAPHA